MTKIYADSELNKKSDNAEKKTNDNQIEKNIKTKKDSEKKENDKNKKDEKKPSKIKSGIKSFPEKCRNLTRRIKRADKSGAVKIIVIFFAVVLVGTILSRAASSILTPHIETSRVSSQKVTHTVYGEGFIEALDEEPVYIYAGILIDEVLVNEGDEIEEGTELVRYNYEMLEDLYEEYSVQMKMYVSEKSETYVKYEINYKIEKLQEELDTLESLIADEGILYSDVSGYLTKVNVTAGEYAIDTAAFYIANSEDGYKLVVSISALDKEYVDKGTSASIQASGVSESCEVSSVTESTTMSGCYDVECMLANEKFTVGSSATVTFTKESDSSGVTVPVEAVRADSSGSYVLVVDYKNTILGEEMVAKKISVKALDSNDIYAVVSSDALSSDDIVIVNSDKAIEAGDVVRYED